MEGGEVAHVDDLEIARGVDARLLQEGVDGLVRLRETGVVGADDAGGIGDADRRALGLHPADCVLGRGFALGVGGRARGDRHVELERSAAGHEEDRHARDVDDRRKPALHRAADHELDPAPVRREHLRRQLALHLDQCRAVEDRVAARHRPGDGRLVRDVASDDVGLGDPDAVSIEDAAHFRRIPDEQPNRMPRRDEGPNAMRPREPRPARHHHAHRLVTRPDRPLLLRSSRPSRVRDCRRRLRRRATA